MWREIAPSCPQRLWKTRALVHGRAGPVSTPSRAAGDTSGVKLALLAAAVALGGAIEAPRLPALPRDGLVAQTTTGLRLTTLAGGPLANLPGYRFAFECGYAGAGALRGAGRLWALEAARSRLVPRPGLRKRCLYARNLVVRGRRIAG